MSTPESAAQLYRQHLETLDQALARTLATAAGEGAAFEGVLFHAGAARLYPADDQEIPFRPAAHFHRWVPLDTPDHWVWARPGQKPLVVRVRPQDYWYDTSPPPVSYWEEAVELREVASAEEAAALLKGEGLQSMAYVGPDRDAAEALGLDDSAIAPAPLLAPLDWHRAYKTDHEMRCLRRAARKAAAGHREARRAFENGASEREIHWAYLAASGQLEKEVPYETIVALDAKGAILHYQHKRGAEAAPGKVFLLDAGAAYEGYAADITRTWCVHGTDDTFRALIDGVDALERQLVARVKAGRPFLELHVEAHRRVAALLHDLGIFKVGAEEAFELGLTAAFLPHGLGHHLGLQVHDVGGHQKGPEGGKVPPPEEYPALRNTRILEPGHVVTIEPGIYFIPMLLEPLRNGAAGGRIHWDLVDRLTPLGGVRIEDNILCTEGEPEDFTRPLIEGPRGA
jgi:Xaa-Pro dipeptidase